MDIKIFSMPNLLNGEISGPKEVSKAVRVAKAFVKSLVEYFLKKAKERQVVSQETVAVSEEIKPSVDLGAVTPTMPPVAPVVPNRIEEVASAVIPEQTLSSDDINSEVANGASDGKLEAFTTPIQTPVVPIVAEPVIPIPTNAVAEEPVVNVQNTGYEKGMNLINEGLAIIKGSLQEVATLKSTNDTLLAENKQLKDLIRSIKELATKDPNNVKTM